MILFIESVMLRIVMIDYSFDLNMGVVLFKSVLVY